MKFFSIANGTLYLKISESLSMKTKPSGLLTNYFFLNISDENLRMNTDIAYLKDDSSSVAFSSWHTVFGSIQSSSILQPISMKFSLYSI